MLLHFHRGFPFDQREMDEMANEYAHSLRDGTHELFKQLNELNVPLLVFSAGLGDSILSVLNHAKVMYPNVRIVSNFLQYKNGLLNGLDNNQHTIIHTFNKNENALRGTDYYDSVHGRKHVILMGWVKLTLAQSIEQTILHDNFYHYFWVVPFQWFTGWCQYGRWRTN